MNKTICYECGALVMELSKRSRCVECEYNKAMYNEEENNLLLVELHESREILAQVPESYKVLWRHCTDCEHAVFEDRTELKLLCFKKHKPRFYQPKSGDFTSGQWGWMRKCNDFEKKEEE